MASDRIKFFVKKKELGELLDRVNIHFNIYYVKSGLFDSNIIEKLSTPITSNYLSSNINGDWVHNERFLILNKLDELIIRDIEQRRGGIKYAIDALKNNNSLLIVLGGEYDNKTIIASEIHYSTKSDFTKEFLKVFRNELKKNTTKYSDWYVSNKIESSTRLTTSIDSPEEYDLII